MSAILGAGIMRLVIPRAGKMFRSSVSKNNKALCFCINKGYIESDTLDSLYYFIEGKKQEKLKWLVFVGRIDKIHLEAGGYVYRQRVFFYSFMNMCDVCKRSGITVLLTKDFRIDINSIINCADDMQYLEWYASTYDETIDTFLTNTCKVQIYNVLRSKGMLSPLKYEIDGLLKGRIAYLERAPFLVGSYDNTKRTSSVFINKNMKDERMYATETLDNLESYGFTQKMVEKDVKSGVFKHEA